MSNLSSRSATTIIVVAVGTLVVGYLTATVVDGVVISTTDKSGAE